MKSYLNQAGISLPLALYLATDHYDYVEGAISATALMRPIRQQILIPRVPAEDRKVDLMNLVKSRMGTSIHDGVEKAWNNPETRKRALMALGYPESVHNRIVVNPDYEPLPKDAIPIYMEQRSFKVVNGKTVSGKFDFVAEGRVRDFKSTGTFTWTNNTKDDAYQLQGSIYRWLNPKMIYDDVMTVDFLFTDWVAYKVKSDKNYPAYPVMSKNIPLLTIEDTHQYVVSKLNQFDHFKSAPEKDLPRCTDKELWRKPPVWKYYKGGAVTTRSSNNFDNAFDAYQKLSQDGGKGLVIEVPGEVVACKYCDAFTICTQKNEYIADGSLKV